MLVMACDPFAWKEGAEPMRITFVQFRKQPAALATLAGAGAGAVCANPDVPALVARLRSVQPLVLCDVYGLYDGWQATLELAAESLRTMFFGLDATGLQAPTLHALLGLKCMRHLRWLRLTLGGQGYGSMALSANDLALVVAQCASITSLHLVTGDPARQLPLLHREDLQMRFSLAAVGPLLQQGALPLLTELSCAGPLWNRALSEASFAKQLHRLTLSGGYGDKGNIWLDARPLGQLRHLRLDHWHLDFAVSAHSQSMGDWLISLRAAFTSMGQLRSLEIDSLYGGLPKLLEALPPAASLAAAAAAPFAPVPVLAPAWSLRILTLCLSLQRVTVWPSVEELVSLLERCPSLYVDVRIDERSRRALLSSLSMKGKKSTHPIPGLLEALCQRAPAAAAAVDPVHPRFALLECP